MASKKDMRREDLVVPYVEPDKDDESADFTGTLSSSLPMAAIFTRNRMIGWMAVIFSLQTWMSESADQKRRSTTPGYFSVGMAFASLVIGYLPIFLPQTPRGGTPGSGTNPPAAAPPS